jgi:ABC-type multidrug transport system fused ATPase/permease subunit
LREQEIQVLQKTSPFLILILSMAGVGLTEISVSWSFYYWFGAYLATGILFIVQDKASAKESARESATMQHTLHWIGAMAALALVFLFIRTERVDASQAGLMAVLLLGFAVFTDGLRIHLRYMLVGIYLFITVAIMAYIETYIWWFLLLSVALIALEIYWMRKSA